MKTSQIILNWLIFAAVVTAIYIVFEYADITLPHMPGYMVIFFSFSIAFTWVEILKWGVVKPFNCVNCMSGWTSLLMAFAFHTPFWYFYLFAGLLVGSIYSAIKMRYL